MVSDGQPRTETVATEPAQIETMARNGTGDLSGRIAAVVDVASAQAAAVDRDARFPEAALAALRRQRLLGMFVPREFGGEGATLGDVADACFALGGACASTGMIFAMHQAAVACVARHGLGRPWHEALMGRIAREQLLLASSTTEGQTGGEVRSSVAAVGEVGAAIELERAATVISYGAEADGIVTTARRAPDAAASDQVLVVFLKPEYTLQRLNGWDTLGMRGTCSAGFQLRARGVPAQILPDRYETIHAETMTPVSHLLWSSVWAGVAASAVATSQAFVRRAARQAGGQMPPGAARYGEAASSLRRMRALICDALARFEATAADRHLLRSIDVQTALTLLKVDASDMAVATVMSAMRACGLSGYRQDGGFSLGRHLRDILSAPIMIHNDRILAHAAAASLMNSVPRTLRA